MKRPQLLVTAGCFALLVVLYVFSSTKKEIKPVSSAMPDSRATSEKPSVPDFDINAYLVEVNARITSKDTQQLIEKLKQNKEVELLAKVYSKLHLSLAAAYYYEQVALSTSNKPDIWEAAGDGYAVLQPNATDESMKHFLAQHEQSCYEKGASLDTSNIDYKLKLASGFIDGGEQPMQGVLILLDLVKRDSNNTDAQFLLGKYGIVSGQYPKAIVRLEKVLSLHPENSEALFLLAEAYNSSGNKNKAIELFEKCKKLIKNPELKIEIDNYIKNIKGNS